MKNQYFGDKRDLFKFDLLLDLMTSGGFRQLTYVPMLTPPDSTGEGRLTRNAATGHRHELFEFLAERRSSRTLDIRCWRQFFSTEHRFAYRAYLDDREDYTFEFRRTYFGGIEGEDIRHACIFIDPDIGVERAKIRSADRSKYLFIDDLEGLLKRSHDSLFIIYQHLQKNANHRLGNIADHIRVLTARLDLKAVPFIREGDLAFYAVARDENQLRTAATVFFAHSEKTGRLKSHVTDILNVAKCTLNPEVGVSDLALFGSVARGEQKIDSDIDVMVRFAGPATLRGFFDLERHLELVLGRRIDLVTTKAIRAEMRPAIEREALHAA